MYLVISRSCAQSRRLLVWINDNRSRLYPGILAGLRVLDVDAMACKGVARRVGQVPCLVLRASRAEARSVAIDTRPSRISRDGPTRPVASVAPHVRRLPTQAEDGAPPADPPTPTLSAAGGREKKRFDSEMEAPAQRKASATSPRPAPDALASRAARPTTTKKGAVAHSKGPLEERPRNRLHLFLPPHPYPSPTCTRGHRPSWRFGSSRLFVRWFGAVAILILLAL